LVYDVTNKESFSNLGHWMEELNNCTEGSICKLLVGNKIDMENVVDRSEAKDYAKNNDMMFVEVSAKDNINIDLLFKNLMSEILRQRRMASSCNKSYPGFFTKWCSYCCCWDYRRMH